MKFLNEIMKLEAYSLNDNKISFQRYINQLTVYHYKRSNLYKKFLNLLKYKPNNDYQIHELPFLPVRSFKQFDLLSVNKVIFIKHCIPQAQHLTYFLKYI